MVVEIMKDTRYGDMRDAIMPSNYANCRRLKSLRRRSGCYRYGIDEIIVKTSTSPRLACILYAFFIIVAEGAGVKNALAW